MTIYKVELTHDGSPWWDYPWQATVRDESEILVGSTNSRITKWFTKRAVQKLIRADDRSSRTETYEVDTDS